MSKFQIILIAVCVIAGALAVLIFAGILPGFKEQKGMMGKEAEISMWGIFPQEKILSLLASFNEKNKSSFKINYFEKKSSEYENELLDALASGTGPDIWILTQDMVLKNKGKIYPISFEYYSERNFKDNFTESAELFVDFKNKNVIGLPIAVDPIVLYWNRDLFSSAGIAKPPQYWDEFLTNAQSLTKKDNAGNIIQAGAALGEFKNVKNAKDLLSLLILQTGNPIIKSDTLNVVLGEKGDNILNPTESSIRFFNEFSNPSKSSYSWNRALPNSETMFVNGSLAMYFGYSSEIDTIKEKNPHLNFDIAEMPQIRDGKIKATFAKIYGLVISKNSAQRQTAFSAALDLSGQNFSKDFSGAIGLGSARRDVLAKGTADPILSVVYKSSIMSKAWLEPNPDAVSEIFKNMVESAATGRVKISEAVSQAKGQLEQLLK
jgi:multiple sugar transport system substrate-binding protein